MIDRWDAGFDTPAEPSKPAWHEPTPVGIWRVEIVHASRRTVPWRVTPGNPRGDCITLRLRASADHPIVYVDLPDDLPWLRGHVARAIGIELDLCVPEELVGRLAHVEIGHVRLRDGRLKAAVRRWLPAARTRAGQGESPTLADAINEWATGSSPQRKPQRRSRNAAPRIGSRDDLPF